MAAGGPELNGIDPLVVPYDSGRRAERMGAGPLHLLRGGLPERLGPDVREQMVETDEAFGGEIGTSVRLLRSIAARVHAGARAGRVPVVLGGNCHVTVGAVAALAGGADDLGVVWLDAHGDFNTPESTETGFFDGMGLAMLTGDCWRRLAGTVPGFRPVPQRQVILAGARDLDAAERERLRNSEIDVVPPESMVSGGLPAALARWPDHVTRLYLHVDLDVYDRAKVGWANDHAATGGPDEEQVLEAVEALARERRLAGVTLASYDPVADADQRVLAAALRLGEHIGRHLRVPLD